MPQILRRPTRRLWREIRRLDRFVRLLLLITAIWLVGALLLWAFERQINPDFESVSAAFWNIAVYLFSGLDSGEPTTLPGRIIAGTVLVMSAGVVALLTGEIASFLVERRMGRTLKMPAQSITNHIVLCNWNDKGISIIRELHSAAARERFPIIIVGNDASAADLPEDTETPEFEDVYFIKGDPANDTVLNRANAPGARSVIVLADPEAGDLADAKSILIAMAVNRLRGNAILPWISVEGIAAQNKDHLTNAGANQVISASDFTLKLLCQSARQPGMSDVFRDLLTTTADTNEIYGVPVPETWYGRTYAELAKNLSDTGRDDSNPVILIGLRQAGQIFVNPRMDQVQPLQQGDRAVVLAYQEPDKEQNRRLFG